MSVGNIIVVSEKKGCNIVREILQLCSESDYDQPKPAQHPKPDLVHQY